MSPQRPFFLSGFFAAFRQQPPNAPLSTANKPHQPSNTATPASATSYSVSTPSATSPGATSRHQSTAAAAAAAAQAAARSLHSAGPRAIPIPQHQGRRRGSDSSSEGFREVLGADRMYIGGRTAGGEEKFFKLGMVRKVKSGDRLSLDRMSL